MVEESPKHGLKLWSRRSLPVLPRSKPLGDRLLHYTSLSAGLIVVGLMVAIIAMIAYDAMPAIRAYGFKFFIAREWNPVAGRETYGALPLIWGTVISSGLALAIALPLGVGTAIVLSEPVLPPRMRSLLCGIVELLAAIPSVVYGLWGLMVLIPLLQPLSRWLHQTLGWLPFFSTVSAGPGLLPAVLVLSIMILPFITLMTAASLSALPNELRWGAMAVGATRWETLIHFLLPSSLSGIVGGALLALGRALGETMAVTLLIGNVNQIQLSIFAPANTIASLLANQFASARELQVAALMYAALVLMGITLSVNIVAEWIVRRVRDRTVRL
jgi:phosphate transport system permease protein